MQGRCKGELASAGVARPCALALVARWSRHVHRGTCGCPVMQPHRHPSHCYRVRPSHCRPIHSHADHTVTIDLASHPPSPRLGPRARPLCPRLPANCVFMYPLTFSTWMIPVSRRPIYYTAAFLPLSLGSGIAAGIYLARVMSKNKALQTSPVTAPARGALAAVPIDKLSPEAARGRRPTIEVPMMANYDGHRVITSSTESYPSQPPSLRSSAVGPSEHAQVLPSCDISPSEVSGS